MENFVFFYKPESKNGYLSNWSEHSIVENKKITATSTTISKSNLEDGIYYVVMNVNGKAVTSTKMCIQ